MSKIIENYRRLQAELPKSPEVKILAVSKTFPAQALRELYDFGVCDFGESRAQELAEKAALLPADIRWHFIGTLQANKVRKVLEIAQYIHSVNSFELLSRIDRIAGEEKKNPKVFLELNLAGEVAKSGMSEAEFRRIMEQKNTFANLQIIGIMTMAPLDAPEEELRRIFTQSAALADEYKLPERSMGMSGDYRIAVECGSTLIRIGGLIFGIR